MPAYQCVVVEFLDEESEENRPGDGDRRRTPSPYLRRTPSTSARRTPSPHPRRTPSTSARRTLSPLIRRTPTPPTYNPLHSNGKESEIEEALSDFLRHAPHQAGLTGKSKGQVHRLVMIIQALDKAQELLRDLQESKNLNIDQDLVKKIDDHLKSPGLITSCLISTVSTTKSISLNTYFLNHKKYLAGYTIEEHLKPVSSLNNNLVKKILLWNGTCVKCQDVARGSRFSADVILKSHE
ncbi:unnamed protein product [Mytilus coruscus]|uniref:Uncharacterized protein n=1 Tax=Mytilus coruscus TaxID=42192 RepID=A0A6J8CNR0_MYTCO|nr:unnamed protein product [Mytilus coruscus]